MREVAHLTEVDEDLSKTPNMTCHPKNEQQTVQTAATRVRDRGGCQKTKSLGLGWFSPLSPWLIHDTNLTIAS